MEPSVQRARRPGAASVGTASHCMGIRIVSVSAQLPASMAGAVLRRDVRRGAFIACLIGLVLGSVVGAPVRALALRIYSEDYEVGLEMVLSLSALAFACTFLACASSLWRPFAELARRRRTVSRPDECFGVEVEVLVRGPRRRAEPGGCCMPALAAVVAALVVALAIVCLLWFSGTLFLMVYVVHALRWVGLPLVLATGTVVCVAGSLRTFLDYWLIGGSGQVSMRRLIGRRVRLREVSVHERNPGFSVSTGAAFQPLEVVGVSWETGLEYAEWLLEQVGAQPDDYRASPGAKSLSR